MTFVGVSTLQMRFAEIVAFTAAVMALGALSIDIMLPALGAIGRDLGAITENDAQSVIYAFTIGYGVAQLFFGPISDRYGRRAVLLGEQIGAAFAAVHAGFSEGLDALRVIKSLSGEARAEVAALDEVAGLRRAQRSYPDGPRP